MLALSDTQRRTWRKLLYLKQQYPDNYVDASFLAQLKRNTTVTKYSYWKLMNDFALIVFHVSNLFLVILVFSGIYTQRWNPLVPTIISSIFSIVGYLWKHWKTIGLKRQSKEEEWIEHNPYHTRDDNSGVKPFLRIIVILLVSSPVLRSLTRSSSSDSIWALSFILTVFNSIFHDYAFDTSPKVYRPILSANISLSNAIVLASRLGSTVQAFSFILFAIQTNILMPTFTFFVRKHYPGAHRAIGVSMVLVVHWLIGTMRGWRLLLVWVTFQVVLTFAVPFYFLSLQKYKNEIQGPWDVAKPVIRTR